MVPENHLLGERHAMMPKEPCALARQAATILRDQADKLWACPAPRELGPWVIKLDALESTHTSMIGEIRRDITDGDHCVYVIELTDDLAIQPLRKAVCQIKKEKISKFAFAQYNESAPDSRYLYVGSSFFSKGRRDTLSTRLKQHLGFGNRNTYALHLRQWARDLPGSVKITALQYPGTVKREAILAIENCLADKCKPLLGRRGSAK